MKVTKYVDLKIEIMFLGARTAQKEFALKIKNHPGSKIK